MTVAELIEALKAEDPEAVVVVMDDEWGSYDPVRELVKPRYDYRVDKSIPWIELRPE